MKDANLSNLTVWFHKIKVMAVWRIAESKINGINSPRLQGGY